MERPAPFHLTENPNTLLDKTDLVFIDAVTTGLSRPVGKAKPASFKGSVFIKSITISSSMSPGVHLASTEFSKY